MKNKLFSGLFAILALVCIAAGIVNDTKGNHEAAVRCYVGAFASLAIPTVAHAKFQRMQEISGNHVCFGFLNKSFFHRNDDPYTLAELTLMKYLSEQGKGQTRADAASGKLKMETYARAFRFEIPDAFSGSRELLNAATVYVDGVIPEEWDRGQLPDGWNVAVSHVGIGFVADASVTSAVAAVALASIPNSWPAVLRNGKLRFSQAGAVVAQIDCLYCGTMGTSTGRLGEDDAAELQAPFILAEAKATKFELLGAGAQAFGSPVGGNFLEIRFLGAFVRPRA